MLIIIFSVATWVLTSLIAAIFGAEKRLGFFGTLLTAIFFSPPVGVLCAFISGYKNDYPNWKA